MLYNYIKSINNNYNSFYNKLINFKSHKLIKDKVV